MEFLARHSIRILHVEDDNDFAELSSRSLNRAGFKQPIVRCSDGLLALHYFSMIEPRAAPHVILLDFHMLGMNGLEVLHCSRWDPFDPSRGYSRTAPTPPRSVNPAYLDAAVAAFTRTGFHGALNYYRAIDLFTLPSAAFA